MNTLQTQSYSLLSGKIMKIQFHTQIYQGTRKETVNTHVNKCAIALKRKVKLTFPGIQFDCIFLYLFSSYWPHTYIHKRMQTPLIKILSNSHKFGIS